MHGTPPELAIETSDILSMQPRVKQLFLTTFQEAVNMKHKADEVPPFLILRPILALLTLQAYSFDDREALLRKASVLYISCLESNTCNVFACHNLSRICWELVAFHAVNEEVANLYRFLGSRCESIRNKYYNLAHRSPFSLCLISTGLTSFWRSSMLISTNTVTSTRLELVLC